MVEKVKAILLLGTNLNNRLEMLRQTVNIIEVEVGVITSMSDIYESEAWGFESENNFLNQVVEVELLMPPLDLLKKLKMIEEKMGRVLRKKGEPYSDRAIDIDILFYSDLVLNSELLIIPHKEIQNRGFALIPLLEINAEFIHPVEKKSIRVLLEECNDETKVWKYEI